MEKKGIRKENKMRYILVDVDSKEEILYKVSRERLERWLENSPGIYISCEIPVDKNLTKIYITNNK